MNLLSRLQSIIRSHLNSQLAELLGQKTKKRTHYYQQKRKSNFDNENESKDSNSRNDNNYQDTKVASYYAALEIPYGSDINTIKAAWRRLQKKYHPDLYSQNPEKIKIAQEVTQGINEAYNELKKAIEENRI
ncbi:DnaJ domain-containing protein [candidate division KSB1 bacterium]|nr:DnaJ domain-containing protein [candidate division KSB1 bacterium]